MQYRRPLALLALFLTLAACAPQLVDREVDELIVNKPYSEAFSLVSNTINTQSYPDGSSGWVIRQSDQVGGFIAADLNYREWTLFGGWQPKGASVSVALVDRGDGTTATNISATMSNEYGSALASRIRSRLIE